MTKHVLVCAVLAACGGSTPPPVSEPPPGDPTGYTPPPAEKPMTPEECTVRGAFVKGDIGDGKVECGPNQTYLGRVSQGIEGAVCCADSTP